MTANSPVYNAQGEQVILGREVGAGAQAAVYLIRNRPDLVAKLYREPLDDALKAKIEALVRLYTPELEAVAVWPSNTLHDHRQALTGLVRPFLNLGDYRELPYLYSPALRLKAFPKADWSFMVRVAAQVAQAFDVLHANGQVMGDVNGLNVLVSSVGRVRLVNVDAYQVRLPLQEGSAQVFHTPVGYAEYLPPELQEQDLTDVTREENHDLFGLAVLIFQLIFDGRHPYAGIPERGEVPSPAHAIAANAFAYSASPRPGVRQPPETLSLSALPAQVQTLFERAFSAQHTGRPSAQEWEDALNAFAAELVECQEKPEHQHLKGQPCPWCELERIGQVSPVMLGMLRENETDTAGEVQTLWQQIIHVPPPLRSPAIPEVKLATPLPELALNLPETPKVMAETQRENIVRWVLRITALALLMAATFAVQRSILAGLVVPTIVIFAVTIGRRMSVDWDAMIDSYQNWEGKLAEGLLPARGKWQAYHEAIKTRQKELNAQLPELESTRTALEERYHRENAHAEYQRDLAALEEKRRLILQGQERQQRAAEQLYAQRRGQAITAYLKRQPIRANILPGLTSRAVLQLDAQGIRSAYDVQADKVSALPEHWAQPLTLWRQGLEDFLPLDAGLVSPQELQDLQSKYDAQLGEQLTQFQRDANRFKNASWGVNEQTLVVQMSELKAQIGQIKGGLKTLENLAKQG